MTDQVQVTGAMERLGRLWERAPKMGLDDLLDGLHEVVSALTGPTVDDFIKMTPTGVLWLDTPTQEMAFQAFDSLVNLHRAMPWLIGDMLNHIEFHYRETYQQAEDATKLAYETLTQYKRVCKAIPYDQRDADRSYSFYKATAHLPADTRAEYEKAIDQGKITGGVAGVRAALQEAGDSKPRGENPQWNDDPIIVEEPPACPMCGAKLGKFACSNCGADLHAMAWRLLDLYGEIKALFETGEKGAMLVALTPKMEEIDE